MEFTGPTGEQRYAEVVRAADDLVVGLDFDGTLSPIVDDPREAHIHPDAPGVLVSLAHQVRAVAVITGRPARQALALGGLDEVADAVEAAHRELHVLGQYGNERWSSTQRRVVSPPPPPGLSGFLRDLPATLSKIGVDPWIEDKGLAVGLHTRRLPDPAAAFDKLVPAVTELARRHSLHVEPGRYVVEVRAPGMDKGLAVHRLADELDAGGFVFAGDDLGDLEAFAAVAELREQGLATLLVCSGSNEESELARLADVVVPGPTGVLELLQQLTEDVRTARASTR